MRLSKDLCDGFNLCVTWMLFSNAIICMPELLSDFFLSDFSAHFHNNFVQISFIHRRWCETYYGIRIYVYILHWNHIRNVHKNTQSNWDRQNYLPTNLQLLIHILLKMLGNENVWHMHPVAKNSSCISTLAHSLCLNRPPFRSFLLPFYVLLLPSVIVVVWISRTLQQI